MTIREKLIDIAIYNKGEFKDTLNFIKSKKPIADSNRDYSNYTSKIVTILDTNYPYIFKTLDYPPIVIFYHGNLNLFNSNNIIGIIGTRSPSKYGEKILENIIDPVLETYATSGKEIIITNGMAKGIDLLSCRIAIKYNLPLIMFLGSGINYIYPSIAEDVYNYCKSGKGVIISEYPDVTKPLAHHFPFRNRLIACSSKKIILPEANLKSRSYSTINQALNYGKEIGTFPFPLSYEKSLNNHLIQDGAEILLNVSDLLSFLKDN